LKKRGKIPVRGGDKSITPPEILPWKRKRKVGGVMRLFERGHRHSFRFRKKGKGGDRGCRGSLGSRGDGRKKKKRGGSAVLSGKTQSVIRWDLGKKKKLRAA